MREPKPPAPAVPGLRSATPRRPPLVPLRGLVLALALASLGCEPLGPGTPYVLAPESVLLDGCFGECLCPVRLTEDLTGGFVLSEAPILAPGPQRLFSVTDVSWLAVRGGEEILIEGEGLYTLDPLNEKHRLTLRLRFDDGPAQELDSGLVPGGDAFPEITIRVSQYGEAQCFDTVFDLRALPGEPPGCGDDAECAAGEYCARPLGACGGPGSCQPRPEACLHVYDPVCGCDGATYPNACEAAAAGVPVAQDGACPPLP